MHKLTKIMVFFVGWLLSCGGPGEKPPINKRTVIERPNVDFQKPYVVRGTATWKLEVEGKSAYLVPPGSGSTVVNTTVAANVKFTLSGASFVPPVAPEDQVESYGFLELTKLRDNKLDVCGVSGTDQCTTAAIIIHTEGAGPGLYNSAKDISLPVSTNSVLVGYEEGNATQLASVSVASENVVRLNDLTGGGNLSIPIEVDFYEAAAGSYEATLVVSYILQ